MVADEIGCKPLNKCLDHYARRSQVCVIGSFDHAATNVRLAALYLSGLASASCICCHETSARRAGSVRPNNAESEIDSYREWKQDRHHEFPSAASSWNPGGRLRVSPGSGNYAGKTTDFWYDLRV